MLDQQQQQLQVLSLAGLGDGGLTGAASALALGQVNLNELGEANLLEMLQVLTRRRDELRLMDKQLFDLMAACFVRLKPAAGGGGAAPGVGPAEAIDLSRLAAGVGGVESPASSQGDEAGQSGAGGGGQKRRSGGQGATTTSPSLHVKKMRLLSGIVNRDDIGEKQQVLAEKELDVREGEEEDDEKQQQQQQQELGKQMIWNSTSATKSSSSSSSCSSLDGRDLSPPEAYQQQANANHHQQQQLANPNRLSNSNPSPRPELGPIDPLKKYVESLGCEQPNFELQQQVAVLANFEPSAAGRSSSGCNSFTSSASSSSSSSCDHDDETASQSGAGQRPQLKKFCSIGSAELSFERFNRQANLIDSTLATLVQQQQQAASMLAPLAQQQQQQQQHEQQQASCFAASQAAAAYRQHVAMLSPHVTPGSLQLQAQRQPQQHHQVGQFAPGALPLALPPAGSLEEQQQQVAVYMQAQHGVQSTIPLLQQQQQQQQPTTTMATTQHQIGVQQPQHKISPFDRMLVNAKDLAPIVRKMSFRCHVCSSCFEDRHRLQQHLSIHLNLHPSWFEEKTIKETMAQYELRRGDYLCQVCQLRYETTADFDKHMHLHGEKPHQCELCQQDNKFVSFRYFRQLLTHLRSHCFLYSCRFVPECRQTANRKDYLKLHILKHHLNNKLPEQFTICCH